MTQYTIGIIIKVLVALATAIILGNGAVVLFNRIPVNWFADYKDDESEERVLPEKLLISIEEGRQRIPSTPWKYIFAGFFGISGVFLAVTDVLSYQIGTAIVLAIALEMAIADRLYQVVPDQFSILLALSSIGFVSFFDNWWEPAAGLAAAACLMAAEYGIGRLIYRKTVIGGADIKFFLAIGCVSGRAGVICIFVLTAVFNGISVFYAKHIQKLKIERSPMLPAAWLALAVYMLFLWNRLQMISL